MLQSETAFVCNSLDYSSKDSKCWLSESTSSSAASEYQTPCDMEDLVFTEVICPGIIYKGFVWYNSYFDFYLGNH